MRLLFAFAGGNGHLRPLLPLAHAAGERGHAVAVTGRPHLLPKAFAGYPAGDPPAAGTEPLPLARLDRAREAREFRDGFGGWIARERATTTRAAAEHFRPDLIICDEADFGSMIAAEALGLPHVNVVVLAAGTFGRPEGLPTRLDETRLAHGLPADPTLAMLDRDLVVSPVPPSFRPLSGAASMRPQEPVAAVPSSRPTVYLTLGTIFNTESGDLFTRLLTGLRTLPIDLVVTVGDGMDPATLGPQPPNVRIERYLPQETVLPRCSAVVSHGGSGSVLGALTHGLPMVLLPMGADQPDNADRCTALGVGLTLDAMDATGTDAAEALHTVLTTPSYRAAARSLQAEIAAMPTPAAVLDRIETLM